PHELEVAPGLESARPQALDFELPHVEKPVEPVGVAEEGGVAGEVEGEEPEREGGREDEGEGVPPRRARQGPHGLVPRGSAVRGSRCGGGAARRLAPAGAGDGPPALTSAISGSR